MCDGDDVGVDALPVAEHIAMQGACLQAVGAAVAQALGRLLLHPPDLDLHLHQLPGQVEVAGDEDRRLGDAKVVDRHVEELRQFGIAIPRTRLPAVDPPAIIRVL
jgi:hypothetical protein